MDFLPQKSQSGPECLIAKYYFDQGNANDDIGTNHGTAVGATLVPNRFGIPNTAYYLNGTPSSYIKLGTSNTLKPQTCSISMWANIAAPVYAGTGYSYNPMLLTKCQSGNDCFEAYCLYYNYYNGGVTTGCTQLFCNQPNTNTPGAVSLNAWHHFVVAYDFNAIYLYCDGVLQGTATKGFAQVFLAGDSIMIGNSANTQNDRYFNGTIDDIRFYNCVLTQSEVNVLYNESAPSGLAGAANEAAVSFYPNPANETVTFSANADVMLTDMLGNEVLNVSNVNSIDISALAAGVYVLTLMKNDAVLRRERLIKR